MTAISSTSVFDSAELEPIAPARPRPVWPVVVGFALLTILLLAAGKASFVRIFFPGASVIVALWCYRAGPAPYIEFCWWMWQVGPGIRRYVDYQMGGWDQQSPMSLTPFLVSGIAIFGVLRRLPEMKRRRMFPWAIAVIAVIYGAFVGILRIGVEPAVHSVITWFTPLMFGLYTALEWRRYPDVQAAMRRAFLFGSIVLAVYGCYQFINPPMWDRVWMVSSGMYSVGRAFPFEVRVFSLVNAPLPFATILVAGLFIALSSHGISRVLALSIGTIALLLSLVRSVWIAGAVGFLIYVASVPLRSARRFVLAGSLAIGVVLTVPFLLPDDIAGPTIRIVTTRFLTFTNLESDVSYRDRASFLDNISTVVADEPLGYGLGSTGVSSTLAGAGDGIRDFDNGVFAVLYSLGWFGGTALLGSAIVLVILSLGRRETPEDTMAKAARAVAVTSILLVFGGNIFDGVSATILWGSLGLVAASHQWHAAGGLPREHQI